MSKVLINRILIVIVSLIWIMVIVQFFRKENNVIIKEQNQENLIVSYSDNKDLNKKITLYLPEKDPFLGSYSKKAAKKNSIKKRVVVKKLSIKVRWPTIKYLGRIKKKTGDQLALLNIQGKFIKLKQGVLNDNYKLSVLEMYKDSVLLEKQGEKKIILINKNRK